MYTALSATSKTLVNYLKPCLEKDTILAEHFDSSSGKMKVSLNTPQEMALKQTDGLSVWLYRVVRDEERLNAPPERLHMNLQRRAPLPLRLHYLITPVVTLITQDTPETEQNIIGKVLQAFHDHPVFRGVDLDDDFGGTSLELTVRLESLSLDEITKVYEALERSYQLALSYEVSVVYIYGSREPEKVAPVQTVITDHGVIVS